MPQTACRTLQVANNTPQAEGRKAQLQSPVPTSWPLPSISQLSPLWPATLISTSLQLTNVMLGIPGDSQSLLALSMSSLDNLPFEGDQDTHVQGSMSGVSQDAEIQCGTPSEVSMDTSATGTQDPGAAGRGAWCKAYIKEVVIDGQNMYCCNFCQ